DASGKLTISRYYALQANFQYSKFSESESRLHAQKFKKTLTDSVRLRMRTDVPLGSCLSGGLDSSTIVCLVNSLISERGVIDGKLVGEHQKTFTAVYDDPRISEKAFVQKVIAQTNADPHFVQPDGERLWNELRQLIYHQDEPFNSTSVYAQWNVMRLAAEHGVTVLLDGQGGDELLAGYAWHTPVYHAELLRRLRLATLWKEIRGNASTAGRPVHRQIYDLLQKIVRNVVAHSIVERILEPNSFMRQEFVSAHADQWGLLAKPNSGLQERLLQEETQLNLQQLLHYEDRNSMAFAIEARVPFIDYRVVECGMQIPPAYKIHDGWSKYALRMAMEGILPKEIQWRKDKMGFVTPQERWLQTLFSRMRTLLLDDSLRAAEFIDRENIEKKFHDNSVDISGNMLWRLVNLEMWMRIFDIQ
ncbi:MAG TPA: asparagine synthase C-terminal domain-containing protein, partial [Bacteroidota bacterium]|nr:asparagine synthase C-terminal domain-containing protein [Bacteroidota bacterium]